MAWEYYKQYEYEWLLEWNTWPPMFNITCNLPTWLPAM